MPSHELFFFLLPRSVENHTGKIFELVVEAKDQGSPPKISRALVRVRVLDTINSRPEIYVDILSSTGEGRAEVNLLHGFCCCCCYLSIFTNLSTNLSLVQKKNIVTDSTRKRFYTDLDLKYV